MHLSHAVEELACVCLRALAWEDRDSLSALADASPEIFQYWPRQVRDGYRREVDWLLCEQEAGRWLAHVVCDAQGRIVGQTCYLSIRPEHAGVEIGGTWYAPHAQGGPINPSAKLALLRHAFACGAERVELKTDALNARSRAAILKLGATFEGVHRRHMRRPDGSWRDTAWFSILPAEWPQIQTRLEARIAAARA